MIDSAPTVNSIGQWVSSSRKVQFLGSHLKKIIFNEFFSSGIDGLSLTGPVRRLLKVCVIDLNTPDRRKEKKRE